MKKEKKVINRKYIVCLGAVFIFVVLVAVGVGTWRNSMRKHAEGKANDNSMNYVAFEDGASWDLENGLSITNITSYTGIYNEDASDEEVSDVMMIEVSNNNEKPLQYAEIILTGEEEDAVFKLSTLNPGQTATVLEAERKTYADGDSYTDASVQYEVFFSEPLNVYEEIFEIQPLDGGFNITNISEEDITGEILVYFKDCAGDVLQGGITYRGRIENGLKAGEIRQIMTDNFTQSNTKVMFITIAEE